MLFCNNHSNVGTKTIPKAGGDVKDQELSFPASDIVTTATLKAL